MNPFNITDERDQPFAKAYDLMENFHNFCTAQGWDCYSVVFTDEHENFDSLAEAGNGFIRQCTTQECNSTGRRMICGLPVPRIESTDKVAFSQGEKPS